MAVLDRYRLIIFDLDGTLVDAYKAIEKSFNYTMKNLGYPRKNSLIIRRAVGWGDENLLKPFLKREDLKRAIYIYRKNHTKSLPRYSRLLPGVKKVLSYLKDKGYKLAIASNRPTRFTKLLINHLNIERYLDFVLCADRLKNIKPHPGILIKIIKRLAVSRLNTLYVGDMVIDIQAGKNAKIDTIAVLTGSHSKKKLIRQKPLKVISNVEALLNIL